MQSGSVQNVSGRAFEFAVLTACLDEAKSKGLTANVVQTNGLKQAMGAFEGASADARSQLMQAAHKGVEAVLLMEPKFSHPKDGNDHLVLYLQNDAAGAAGDVRDLVIERPKQEWQIGISAKHQSNFIKSARLSDFSGFAERWLDLQSSENFRNRINAIYQPIRNLIGQASWSSLGAERKIGIYIDLAEAFKDEILHLETVHGSIVPARFLQFLLGNNDFYKVQRMGSTTQVQPFNINGKLGKQAGRIRAIRKPPVLPVPTRIFCMERVSDTTLHLYCDKGWQVALRVHNKDTIIAASIGLEAHLIGHPSELFTLLIPWSVETEEGEEN